MTSRTRLVLVVIGALALPTAIFAALAARDSDSNGPAAMVEEVDSSGAVLPPSPFEGATRPDIPPTDFALQDQDGDVIQLSKLRGTVVVLTPLYTHCEESCPVAAQQVRGALDDLSGSEREGVRAFGLSVDPANDTADTARRFLVDRRVSGYLDFLLGARGDLQPVWRDFGFAPQTQDQEHNSHVVLIDKRGRQRVGFPLDHLTPEALAHDIAILLKERS